MLVLVAWQRLGAQPPVVSPGIPAAVPLRPGSNSYSSIDRNVYRYDYLADLFMTQPESLPLRPEVSRTVAWKGAGEYVAELQAARQQLAGSRETDGLKPKVEFNVIDKRANQQPPLTVPEY